MRSLIPTAFLFVFLIIFSDTLCFAQQFYIQGSVHDKDTEEPLENVNVKIKGTNEGTSTNELGEFRIKVSKLPVILVLSHISYETLTMTYEYPPMRELEIVMSPTAKALQGIIVKAQKIDTVYKDDEYSVLDYELTPEGIMLLVYKARLTHSELLFTDFEGREILKLSVLPGKPLALYQDCLGNVHIVTKTRVYQVYMDDDKLLLLKGVDVDYFFQQMQGCLFRAHDKLYFEKISVFGFVKKIFYIELSDTSFHELATITDTQKIDMLYDNPEDLAFLSETNEENQWQEMEGSVNTSGSINTIRNLDADSRFLKMAFYSKINAPVMKLADSVCVFDHPDNTIKIYGNNDSLMHEIPVDYHLGKKENAVKTLIHAFAPSSKWLGKVYTDPVTGKAWTLFQNIDGTRDLQEIDLHSGETRFMLTIPYPYVRKIKIRDGFLYFVYRGWGEGEKNKLFRAEIR